ncbi:MAG TPA: ABC transporter permease, partial [Subdoligranulum variabile]|nr:ABC transporter permease [Subdoligranulum variabile]
MLLLIKYTLLYGIVLMLVALGGMFSEHSGIINIALEGIMVIGGLGGVLAVAMLPNTLPPLVIVTISILVAALSGMVFSLLLAFASINLKADQTIGGTALNMLATAIAIILAKNFNGSTSSKINYTNNAFLFKIGSLELSVFVPLGIVLLIISYIVMYKTRFGLRLRACGEHPQAADSVGINVYKMRYAGVLISGVLGGIGGLAYIIPSVQTWNFEVGVAGTGFLALAVMIFGQWKPVHIFGAAMFFAVFKSL